MSNFVVKFWCEHITYQKIPWDPSNGYWLYQSGNIFEGNIENWLLCPICRTPRPKGEIVVMRISKSLWRRGFGWGLLLGGILAVVLVLWMDSLVQAEEVVKEPVPSKDLIHHQQEHFGKPGKYSTRDGNGYFEIETKYEEEKREEV